MAVTALKDAAEVGTPPSGKARGVDGACELIGRMAAAGGMGPYIRTALFASQPGVVTRLHYDHYDNIYVQLRGRKRFVLLAPLEARGPLYRSSLASCPLALAPFPPPVPPPLPLLETIGRFVEPQLWCGGCACSRAEAT